jgi:hypothetical protein
MTRRHLIRMASPFLLGPLGAEASPCQSNLDPRTAEEYDDYLKTARTAAEQALEKKPLERVPNDQRAEGLRTLDRNQPFIWNLNKNRANGALAVYKGVVVDWMGAFRVPGATIETLADVLQQYDSYKKWYKPYIFDCYAKPIAGPGVKNFAVTSILHDVYEKPAPLVPDQHFSFEIMAESNYFWTGSGDARTLMVRTHAKSIREANSGHPEHADSRSKNDLLPAAHGQGVLWRSDTWWRATRIGSDLYAEYESLSLARSVDAVEFFSMCSVLRLPGLKDKALESMTVRPRRTVTAVVTSTKLAVESASRPLDA